MARQFSPQLVQRVRSLLETTTQKQIAATIGVSAPAFCVWLNGANISCGEDSDQVVAALCALVELPMDQAFVELEAPLKRVAPPKQDIHLLACKIEPAIKREFEARAEEHDHTVSELLRRLIGQYLAHMRKLGERAEQKQAA